jgi:D-hexose-6-phosphate mutarotase
MHDFDALNQRFAAQSSVHFGPLTDGFIVAEIRNAWSTARISLYGGHLLSWQPSHQTMPVLWLSKRVQYLQGKAIRGGVPICWPWFGAHPALAKAPAHGYARVSPWEVVSVCSTANGETEMLLELGDSQIGRLYGTKGVSLSLQIRVGAALELALTTTNEGDSETVLSEGLHTYFQVSDVSNIRIHGLEGAEYADLLQGNLRCQQSGAIAFEGELGRIFVDSAASCVIEDPGLQRRIRVEKSGSLSTAVWNPWTATASKMDDLGPEGWRDMVCVESANALENLVTLPAGQSHTLTARYFAEGIPPARPHA